MSENKNLNNQKFIEGVPESSTVGTFTGNNYEVSTNLARDVSEVNQTRSYVIRNDGINISSVIFPHDMQIGLGTAYQSDLRVQGDVTILGDLEIRGQTTGIESGGGGSTKVVYKSRMNLTNTGKFFTWQGANTTGMSVGSGQVSNSDTMIVAPFDGSMTAVQMIIKANSTSYNNLNKIVIDIYKNAKWNGHPHNKVVGEGKTTANPVNLSTDLEAGGSGNQFSIKIDDIDAAGSNMYFISRPITMSVSTGDILHFVGQRVGGTNKEAMMSVVLTETSDPTGGGDPGP